MNDPASTPAGPKAADREQATLAVLPVLTSLDQQATALEQASDQGGQITQGNVVAYELAVQHARHLIVAGGLSPDDIKTAAAQHGGAQACATVDRALEHATHARAFEPTPPVAPERDQDIEEEVEL
ncbi:hypothetical protein [Streptomyces achromogenes]|uniref:hypothetical protein n=1 Tax=Streptomyces achromogenes TaxID=67255 RepID=UPI00342F0C31